MNNEHADLNFEERLANEAFWKEVFGPDNVPVKEIKPGSRYRTLPGWFPTRKNVRGEVRTREPLMIDLLLHLDVDSDILVVAEFPFKRQIRYRRPDGSISTKDHIPDVAVLRRDGLVFVIDVMPFNVQVGRLDLTSRKAAMRKHYRALGARYLLLDETTLRLQPLLSNIKSMWMHRKTNDEPSGMADLRRLLLAASYPTTIEELMRSMPINAFISRLSDEDGSTGRHVTECNPVFSAVMQMTMSGELDVDLTRRLSPRTVVTRRSASHA